MTSRISVLPGLTAAAYERHSLHQSDANWVEKNCYIDLWIECLHALRLEPLAILPFTATIDFEGDQWTFFKPSHEEIRVLYGVDVQELTVWRPLIDHVTEHVANGKWISTEADAWWLPDTAGTDYRRQHTKTTIAINDVDLQAERMGYFHNAGYYELDGEDFRKTFRIGEPANPEFMPFFAEIIRVDGAVHRSDAELASMSRGLWARHLNRLPRSNPIHRFAERFGRDLPTMQDHGLPYYHAWAFAATRQLGAAFELAGANLRWLSRSGEAGLEDAIAACDIISATSKSFILKGARAVSSKRPFDGTQMFADLASAWDRATSEITLRLGR